MEIELLQFCRIPRTKKEISAFPGLKSVSVIAIILAAVSVVVLLVSTAKAQIIGNILILLISVVAAMLVNKRVTLSTGYEEK